MRLGFEISDTYVERLSKWASISRTLTESLRLVEELRQRVEPLKDMDQEVVALLDRIELNSDELQDITMAIDHLHQMARSNIWELQAKKDSAANFVKIHEGCTHPKVYYSRAERKVICHSCMKELPDLTKKALSTDIDLTVAEHNKIP